jgi:hypothetical protein
MKITIEIPDDDIRQRIIGAVVQQYINDPEKMGKLVNEIEHAGWLYREVKDEIVRRIADAVIGNNPYNIAGLDNLLPAVVEKLDSDFLKEQIMARLLQKVT